MFLWEVQQKAEEYAQSTIRTSWRLMDGVEVYVNPEFRCPYCGGGFPTKRIWMVNTERRKILGCWYLEDPVGLGGLARLRKVGNSGSEVVHPHADGFGDLCMGTSTSAFQLLFHSIAPGKHHRHTDMWLLNVGHDCPNLPRSTCRMCQASFPTVKGIWYGMSSLMCSEECEQLARSKFCVGCFTPLEEGRPAAHEGCCAACFDVMAKICSHCNTAHLPHNLISIRLGWRVCAVCLENASGTCRHCSAMTPYKELSGASGNCPRCQITHCVRCGDIHRRSDLTEDGHCTSCQRSLPPREIQFTEGESCNLSTESLSQEQEALDIGSSGLSAEITQAPE